jgi:hypothetical protein
MSERWGAAIILELGLHDDILRRRSSGIDPKGLHDSLTASTLAARERLTYRSRVPVSRHDLECLMTTGETDHVATLFTVCHRVPLDSFEPAVYAPPRRHSGKEFARWRCGTSAAFRTHIAWNGEVATTRLSAVQQL